MHARAIRVLALESLTIDAEMAQPTAQGPRGREITDARYLAEVGRAYRGRVIVGHDLDIY